MCKESMSRSLSVSLRCNAANVKLFGSLEDPPRPLQRRRFSKQSRERAMAGTRAGRRPGRRPGSGIIEPPVPETYPLLGTSGSGLTRLRNMRDLRFRPYYTSEYDNRRFSSCYYASEYENLRFRFFRIRNMRTAGSGPSILLNMRTSGSFLSILLNRRTAGSILGRG